MTPEAAEQRVVELDQLGVDSRVVAAERLDRSLPVLAVAAAARCAVAVHRGDREELHRLRVAVHAVLDVRPADRRRAFGPERERAVGAVGEGVHLLLHDVGARAGRAREERRVLEDRRHDPAVAVEPAEPLDLAASRGPRRGISAGTTSWVPRGRSIFTRSLTPPPRAAASRSSARNGFRARARRRASSTARGPGGRPSRGGNALDELPDRGEQRRPVAAREVGATDRARQTARRPRAARRRPRTRDGPASGPARRRRRTGCPASSSDSPPSRSTSASMAGRGARAA